MSEVIIRLARADDAMQVGPLHVQVWNEAYDGLIDADVLAERAAHPMEDRVAMWRQRFLANPTYVAETSDGRIVGFVTAGPGRDSDMTGLELMALYVASVIYNTGVGHRLLVEAVGEMPAYLWVLDGNERAIRFYKRHGFRFDGTTRYDPPYGTESRMVRPQRNGWHSSRGLAKSSSPVLRTWCCVVEVLRSVLAG
jgi:GNAT superfamily N-acetyltransferase